ncbi:sodium-extruding oxaloacetate decarboxylase subunit alpha [bacterium]|nr:sodium-extruding oxaloacetate decarboxylase subunit alpha [bacterium]MBU1600319.1 sodium-extruding oxaloacetate decarboxylase subunit alpha [bacterium]
MPKILDTTLRDGHQSLIATRMRTEDMLPIAERLDKIGFYSLEVWGGATFDVCLRFLAEDPWTRLRKLKEIVKNTPLQMLLRGQNLVGYRHYADDVAKRFVELSVKNGIDIIRIFDALNDIRNMEVPIKAAKDAGATVQGAISYTTSPVHTIERFVEMAIRLEEFGCDVICIKDMAGLITPRSAYQLVSALKEAVRLPIDLHTHMTSGMGMLSYYTACEAGVDIVDCAFSPFAGGTSQPALEPFVASLQDTEYDPGLDLERLIEIGYYFLNVKQKYQGLLSPVAEKSDVGVKIHQIPGGMISNLYSQLKEQKALDRYNDVLKEVPRVREDLGYPPLVTPTSQIIGTQAVLNVLLGERYKRVTEEVKNYCLGLYGQIPAPIKEDLLEKVIGKERPIVSRPADLLSPELEKAKKEIEEQKVPVKSEEDILSYVMYPQVAARFLKGETKPELLPPNEPQPVAAKKPSPDEFIVTVDDEEFRIKIRPVEIIDREEKAKVELPKEKIPEGAILSPMQGMVVSMNVGLGDSVKKGQAVAMLEAMKMQTNIVSDHEGVVRAIYTFEGEIVDAGDLLMAIS